MALRDRWKIFGKWLANERGTAGVSQKLAAYKAAISAVQLNRIERGNSGVKRDTLMDIVEAINENSSTGHKLDLDEALYKAGFSTGVSPDEERGLFKGAEHLTPEQKKVIQQTIDVFLEKTANEPEDYDYIDDEEN